MKCNHLVITAFLEVLSLDYCIGGQTDKAFEGLKNKDFVNAKVYLDKILKSEPKDVAGNFGMSVYLSDKENKHTIEGFRNYEAFQFIVRADSSYKTLSDKEMGRLVKYAITSESINLLKKSIARNQLDFCKRNNNDFKKFIMFFKLYPDLVNEADSLVFNNAMKEGTFAAFKAYFETYPSSRFVNEAKEKYELTLYKSLTKDNTWQEYDKFYKSYPGSPYTMEAKDKYERGLYESSTKEDTWQEYEQFYKNHTESPYANNAKKLYEKKFSDYNEGLKVKEHAEQIRNGILFYNNKKLSLSVLPDACNHCNNTYEAEALSKGAGYMYHEQIKCKGVLCLEKDYITQSSVISNGVHFVTGYFQSERYAKDPDAFIAQIDTLNEVKWLQTFKFEEESLSPLDDKGVMITPSRDGGCIVVVESAYSGQLVSSSHIIKLNKFGKVVLNEPGKAQSFFNNSPEYFTAPSKIFETSDGTGFLVLYEGNSSHNFGSSAFYFKKMSNTGSDLWDNSTLYFFGQAIGLVETKKGYIIVGNFSAFQPPYNFRSKSLSPVNDFNVFSAMIDFNGKILDVKPYLSNEPRRADKVEMLKDGNILITGKRGNYTDEEITNDEYLEIIIDSNGKFISSNGKE